MHGKLEREVRKNIEKERKEVTGSPVICSMSEILGIKSEIFNKFSSESINRIK